MSVITHILPGATCFSSNLYEPFLGPQLAHFNQSQTLDANLNRCILYDDECSASSHACVAAGLSSISFSMPATKTPSNLSKAKFSRSQLRLFTRNSDRHEVSRLRLSLASCKVVDVTKSRSMKLEAMVKLVRASGYS